MTDPTPPDVIAFSAERHGEQKYAGQPISYHFAGVERILSENGFTGPVWRARAYLHDVFEDTETTQHEVYELFGAEVADPCWAVTGEGETREQQQQSIRDKVVRYRDYTPAILKCADRIDNLENCIKDPATGQPNTKYGKMYLDERAFFCAYIQGRVPTRMMTRLELTYDALARVC